FFGPDSDGDGVADRIVFQWDFADDDGDASDRNGHGSHVASIIAGDDDRYGGVAPGTELIVLKVFGDDGKGYFRDLEEALQWVVDNAEEWNVGVVNLSVGDGGNWGDAMSRYGLGDELGLLAQQDIIVVGAAGNAYARYQSAGLAYPASDPAVLAVGATWAGDFGGPWSFAGGSTDYTTDADRIAAFSQRDGDLDVFAPGARFNGADANGGVRTMQGTSQAAAFVSGTAALAQQIAMDTLGRRLSTTEFAQLLQTTGVQIVDGDDENDNVRNTGDTFTRVDLSGLLEAIAALPESSTGGGGNGGDGGGGGGTTDPNDLPVPGVHAVSLASGETRSDLDFGGNRTPQAVADAYTVDGSNVFEVDVTDGLLANDTDPEAQPLLVELVSGPAHGTLELETDGSFSFVAASGYTGEDSFTYRVTDGLSSSAPVTVTLDIVDTPLQVTGVTATASGFHVQFNRAVAEAELDLWGATPDLVVTGPTGALVRGSLVVDADRTGFTFVKTGGVLATGDYSIKVVSGAQAFRDTAGRALDGDADGTDGGDYIGGFTVAPLVGPVVGLTDLVRGPGQQANLPASANGLPVSLSATAGIDTLAFTLVFDPQLLQVQGASVDPALPVTVETEVLAPGRLRISLTVTGELPAGSLAKLLTLQASVPSTAPYGARQVLDITDVTVNGIDGAGVGDDAVHVAGYIGDTSGDGAYTAADAQQLQRVIAGAQKAFAAWPLVDPTLIGDANGNGSLNAVDAQKLALKIAGRPVAEMPDIPVAPPAPQAASLLAMEAPVEPVAAPAPTAAAIEAAQTQQREALRELAALQLNATTSSVASPVEWAGRFEAREVSSPTPVLAPATVTKAAVPAPTMLPKLPVSTATGSAGLLRNAAPDLDLSRLARR
ncbi:MAG: S8 family serine peptidase, partial [Burkholderiales bacterium]|nr:S8 family serine peptidase [Burkholderiales bacterium]